jgi:hypothetical protein
MHRFRQGLYAWIAIFAMAMSALAPAVSRAMGPDEHGRYLVELCSAAGVEWVELSAEEAAFYGETGAVSSESGPAQSVPSLDHCPYCSAQFGNALPPSPDLSQSFAVAGGAVLPTLFLVAPRPLFAWSPAHPRAPPARA